MSIEARRQPRSKSVYPGFLGSSCLRLVAHYADKLEEGTSKGGPEEKDRVTVAKYPGGIKAAIWQTVSPSKTHYYEISVTHEEYSSTPYIEAKRETYLGAEGEDGSYEDHFCAESIWKPGPLSLLSVARALRQARRFQAMNPALTGTPSLTGDALLEPLPNQTIEDTTSPQP